MRKKLSLKNFISSIIPYVIVLILGFVKVDVFLSSLGEDIYALNQLFFQLFAYISLAEGGATNYIIQLYYKHFVENNKEKIKEIYRSSVLFMRKIAMIVFIVGFGVSFFLKFLTNNNLSSFYMQIVFIIFIVRSCIEYLLMSPKLVMQADQKLYKINIIYYIFKILELMFEIVLLKIGVDYITTLISSTLLRTLSYVFINRKVFKQYPWLKEKSNKNMVKIKGINNMFVHRIAEAIHYNTDIILVSSFLKPLVVTIYSSYNYITKYLTDGVDIVGNSMSASVGNVIYKEDNESKVKILDELLILYLVFAVFFCSACFILINSFIKLWIGSKYIIDSFSLILIIINLFIVIARKPLNIYFNSAGWYKETRLIVFLEAIVNLVFSLLLVKKFRLVGLLFGTLISMLLTTFWYIPKFVWKDKLGQKLSIFFARYLLCFSFSAILSFIGYNLINRININSYIYWIFIAIIISIIIGIIILIIFYLFSKSFRRLFNKIFALLHIRILQRSIKNEKEI